METRFKRFLSLALAIVMVIGMMPTNIVYATETGDSGSDVVEETTAAPTEVPTEAPTEAPTEEPTEEPTEAPTEEPTEAPTEEPTEAPSEEATEETTEEVKAELSGETRKIYFHNVEGWDEVWAAWSFDEEDFEDVAHPGEEMNSNTELEGVYVIKVPVEADGVLFSDGIEVTEALLEQERLEGVTVTHEIEVRLAGDKFYNLYQNEAWANYAKTVEALEATEGTEAPTEDPAVSEVQAMIAGLPTEVNSEAEYQATKNTLAAIDEIVESDSFPADAYQTLDWAKIEAAYGALDAYEQEDRSQVQLDGNTVRHHGIIISEADLVSELNKISGETVVYTAAGTAYYPDATKLGYTVSNGTKSQNINAGNDVTWLEDGQNYTVTYYVMSGSFGKLQYTQHSFTFTYEIYQIVTAAAVDTNGNAVPGGGVKVTVNGTTTTLANGDTLEVDYNTPVTVEAVAVDGYQVQSVSGVTSPVTADGTVTVTYKADVSYDVTVSSEHHSTVKINGEATTTKKLAEGTTATIEVTPASGNGNTYYVSGISVNDNPVNVSYNNGTATASFAVNSNAAVSVTYGQETLIANGTNAVALNGYVVDSTLDDYSARVDGIKEKLVTAVMGEDANPDSYTVNAYVNPLTGSAGYYDVTGWQIQNNGSLIAVPNNALSVQIVKAASSDGKIPAITLTENVTVSEARPAPAVTQQEVGKTAANPVVADTMPDIKSMFAVKGLNGADVAADNVTVTVNPEALQAGADDAKAYTVTLNVANNVNSLAAENLTYTVYIKNPLYHGIIETSHEHGSVKIYSDSECQNEVTNLTAVPGDVTNGKVYYVKITTDAGYEFAGLTVNGTAVADADTVTAGQLYKLTVKSNENAPANTYAIAVTAAPKSYNVIWDANGGEFAEGKKSMTTSVVYDTEIAKLDAEPTREGYKFVGWTGFVEGTKIGTADVTYKAAWEIQSYTIKWIVEGETIKEETLEYGATIEAPTVAAKDGYSFKWNETILTTMPAQNVTYTGSYTAGMFNVNWVVDGKTTTEQYEVDTTITVPADPTKEGHTFAGWSPEVVTTMGPEDVTYTATWTKNKYTVKWTIDGETTSEDYEYGSAIVAPADPTKDGHTFIGWTPKVAATMGANDVEYTATWSVNNYTIKFVDEDGTPITSNTVAYGTMPEAPADPTKADTDEWDYTFAGWDANADGEVDGISAVTGDTTYKAVYSPEKRSYEIKWVVYGTTYTDTVEYGVKPTAPGYTLPADVQFVSWDKTIVEVVGEETYTANVTLKTDSKPVYINKYHTGRSSAAALANLKTNILNALGLTNGDYDITATVGIQSWNITANVVVQNGKATVVGGYFDGRDASGFLANELSKDSYSFVITKPANGNAPAISKTVTVAFRDSRLILNVEISGNVEIAAKFEPADVLQQIKNKITITATNPQTNETTNVTVADDYISFEPAYAWPADAQTSAFKVTVSVAPLGNETYQAYAAKELTLTCIDTTILNEIVWDANGGKWEEGTTKTDKVPEDTVPTEPAAPAREYYTFAGWTPAIEKTPVGNETYTKTYKATWNAVLDNNQNNVADQEELYTVIYRDGYQDGEAGVYAIYADQAWNSETPIPVNPTRDGYYFKGWDINPEGVKIAAPAVKDSTTITYTATWSLKCNVTFDGVATEYEVGTTVNAPDAPEKDQYLFQGWALKGDENQTIVTFPYKVTDSVDFVSVWAADRNRDGDIDGTAADPFSYYVWVDTNGNELNKADWLDGETAITANSYTYAETANDSKVFDSWTEKTVGATTTYTLVLADDANNNEVKDSDETITIAAGEGKVEINGAAVANGDYVFDSKNTHTIVVTPPAQHYIASISFAARAVTGTYTNSVLTIENYTLVDGTTLEVTYAKHEILADGDLTLDVNGYSSSTIFADITKEAVLEAILGTHYDAAKVNEYTLEMKVGTASIKDKLGALGSGLPDVIDVNIFDLKSLSEKYGNTIAGVVESVIRGSFDLNETETFKLTWDSSDETKPVISGEYVVGLKDDRPYANAWLKEGKGSYNSSTIDDALLALIQEDLETDSNIIGLTWETVPETVDEGKTYELVVIVRVGGTEELQAKDDVKIPVTVTTPVIKASIVIPESAVMIYNTGMTDAKLNEMVVKALNETVPGIVYTPEDLKEHDVTVYYLARTEGTVPVRIQYTGLSGLINIDETIDVPVKALWLNIGEAFPDVGEEPSQADLDKLVEDMIDIYGMELLDMSEAELKNVFLNNIDKYPELKKYITYIGTHEFGYNTEKDANGMVVETVKLQQADFGYGILETNYSKISLNDQRYETYIVLNEGVSLTYGFSEAGLLNALGAKVYAKTENGDVLVSNTVSLVTNIEGMGVSENAEITVKYAGDADNQYCTATTAIAITKAPVKVSVDNQVVKYGQPINMLPVSTNPAGVATIQFIVGLNVNNVNLEDIKVQGLMAQAQLLLPEELQDLLVMAGDAINAATGLNLSFADGASMKLSELQAATGALKDVFKDSQYAEYFNILLNMLDSLPTEVADIEIIIGGTLPTDIGAYLIGAVTADANYENVPGVGVLVITPDGTKAELDWYQDDENYIITQTLLTTKGADGRYLFDTSAKVTSVGAGGSIEAAEAQVVEIFLGVNIDGEITLTTDQTALNVGAYGEIALIADWGNTMYYAVPIARPIVVVAESLNVDFLDENGNVNNVRLVEFDNTAKDLLEGKLLVTYKQNGKGYQAGDELTEYNVKYLYTGVQTNGMPYAKTTAPVHAGAYAVTAIVTVRNGSTITHAGVGHAVLTIEPTTSDISVGNKVVVYDGNAYGMSDKIVATSKVSGLTPDTTVISAGLSANLDQINGLKDITGNVNVDMPAWLDEVIKKLGILDAGYADGITASTFLSYVDKIDTALTEQGIEIDAFDKIVNIINQLPVNTLLTFHDDIKYTNVGAYMFLGVVTDSDHYPSVGAGVLAITPDGTKVQLQFEEDWNGNNIFTWAALEKMNLEAKAYDLNGTENAAATAKVVNLYFGFTDNGEFLLASVAHGDSLESRSDFDNGVYTQMALLLDLGNKMYYAEPITRAFVIVPNAATVEFVDENGNVNADRHFIFNNQPQGMDVRVTVNGKEVTDLSGLTVTYVGVQTNGELYNSTVAPTHSGAYTVAAAYTAHDELDRLVTLGVSVGAMVIEPAQSTMDVQSKLHEYDGNPVATDALVKAGSAVAGITPDKTVITTSISTDGTFSENLLNSITSEVNVDFPAWVDKILTKYAPSIYNGMKAGEFTDKVMTKLNDVAADAKALAEEYNIPADKLINAMDTALTEVEEVVAQLPEDVVLTFKDQTEVAPTAVGTYLIIGIVTDSDHYPSADVGVLVIYPKVTEAKLEWVYKDSNGIFTLPALKSIDLGAMGIVNGAEDETVTDMINYLTVGIDEHGKLIVTNQPDSLTSNGAYTEVAYIPVEIGAEMTVAAPIIRSFLVVPQTVTVEVTDTVATYGKDYEVPVAVTDMDGKAITGDRLKNLKLTYIGVNAAAGLYNSTVKPTNSGIYTVVATYIEKEGNEYAYVGMNVGTLTIVPASATVDVKNRIHEYNGEKFNVMDLITSDPDDAKLAIITAALNLDGDFSEDGILATGTSVNIDFPARADEVIREVLPQAYTDGIALNPFFQKLDDISAKLVEAGFDAAAVETLKNHLAQLPSNTKLTFKEQSEINPSNIGVYLITAVVMDPDYIPVYDAGLLVITADADLATLKWNYRDSNNIITREVIAKMDMAASAYTKDSQAPNAALTDRISYVVMGVGSNGSVTLTDDPAQIKNLPNGVYTEVAYIYQQIDAEMTVAIPIIRTFMIVNHSVDVNFEDIVVPYDGQRHPVEVTINGNPVEKRENLTVRYINLGRGYYSTVAPDQIGSYTVIAKYEETVNGDTAAFGMEIGNVTITPADSKINVTGDTVTYDGKEHSATVTVTGGTGDADYLLISGGAYVKKDLTEIDIDAFYGNVNIDFPAWLDKALDEYEFKKEGIDAAYLIDFIDSHRNNLVAMGLFHEKIDAAINELLSILDRMPKNVSLTFNDDVTYIEPGYYFYYGIVMDPNHYPSSDTGLLIIEKKDMLFDLLDTTAAWTGNGQMVDTNNPQNADFTTVVIDRKNNTINIVLDEDAQYVLNALAKILDVEFDGDVQMSTIIEKYSGKEIADAIVKLIGQLEKLELVNEIQSVLTAVKNELKNLPANGTVTVNGPLPSELGEYEFYAISYSQYFKTVASEAVLTIVKAESEITTDPAAVEDLIYNGNDQELITAGTAEGGKLVYSLSEDGPFTEEIPVGKDAGEYTVYYKVVGDENHNDSEVKRITVTIAKAEPEVKEEPKAVEDLVYNGDDQELITAGKAENGKLVYSLSEDGPFTEEIPVGKDAGDYTVYYKVLGDGKNYTDSEVKSITVNVAKATPEVEAPTGLTATTGQTLADVELPEGFTWADDSTTSVGDVGENEFWVIYTPEDTDNYEPVRIKVTVTVSDSHEGQYPIPFNPGADETGTIKPGSTVDIDGTPVVLDENGIAWVENTDAKIVTTYKYHEGATANETYPTNMYVWYLQLVDKDGDGKMDEYTAERIPELDDLFQYNGTSIRVGDAKNGIRFFTSIASNVRPKLENGTLISSGILNKAKMVRAGTVFKKNPEVAVTLDNGVSSDVYGGKAGSNFRVFGVANSRDWFTGMLVGLDTDADTIKAGIAARPYAELEVNGTTVTIYGGQIERSIYYVAKQNQNTFAAGSAFDNFVEGLITKGES